MDTKVDRKAPASRLEMYRAWLDERWVEWRKIHGIAPSEQLTYSAHRAFDTWLAFRSERANLDPGQSRAVASAA